MKKITIKFHQGALIIILFCVGGGGVLQLQISGDRDDRVGAKINPPKIPRASNKTPKKLWTKIKPPKNPMPNFGATKISRKHEDITWN